MKLRGHGYYRLIYLPALILIGLVAFVSNLFVIHIIERQDTITAIVSVGSKHRMLSQRIAGLSFEFIHQQGDAREQTKKRLAQSLEDLTRFHEALVKGDPELGLPGGYSDEVDEILFSEPYVLDEQVRLFIVQATDFLTTPEMMQTITNPNLIDIRTAATQPLTHALDALVQQIENEARDGIQWRQQVLLASLALVLVSLACVAVFIFHPLFAHLTRQQEELNEMALTDPLTGCHNRRSFVSIAEDELLRVRRYKVDSAVLMLDIDKFKNINDTYGHAVGDEAIKTLVYVTVDKLRRTDILGRMGGEEFAVLLPETTRAQAIFAAGKLREAIEEAETPHEDGTLSFTASIGIAILRGDDESIHDSLNRADICLYAAKEGGRNKVVCT